MVILINHADLGVFVLDAQVHTTGMDIQQPLSAEAALTLGKDMNFRDYAQVGRAAPPTITHGTTRPAASRQAAMRGDKPPTDVCIRAD